ncbi:TPA: hypothetical protein ACPD28_001288 [Pasteurella multocida]
MRKYSVITYREEDSLSIAGNRCSIQGTTKTNGGHRSRHSSGIFLPQIYLSKGNGAYPHTFQKAEFVARATLRNKAHLRTNKGGFHPLVVVVEPLSRLLSVGKFLQNKPTEKIKMKTSQKSTALLAVRSRTPIAFAPAMEVTYA